MRITEIGGAGKFEDTATHALDYCEITSDLNPQTTYTIYRSYDKRNFYWTTLSSDYCIKHDATIGAKVKSLNASTSKPQTEKALDRLMHEQFSRYGLIQVKVSDGDQIRHYDLKKRGSFFDRQYLREATDTPFIKLTHQTIKADECVIL